MASFSNLLQWQNVINGQVANKPTEYPESENYYNGYSITSENPLANVYPRSESFFGPRVLNILIISRNYGWTNHVFTWPPPGYQDAVDRIIEAYDQWSRYKLFVYGDQGIIDKIQASSDPGKATLIAEINQTYSQIETDCTTYKDYGWEWKGRVPGSADYSFFSEEIRKFYYDPDEADV